MRRIGGLISAWAKIAKCSQDTAGRDIQGLITLGILIRAEGAGRSTGHLLRHTLGTSRKDTT